MRNILKAATLESKFPILSVEEGCILSKDADVTIGAVHGHFRRLCIHARHMNKGSQGTAELYDSTPPGLVSERKLQGRHAERRDEFFGPFFRTSF